MAEIRPLRRRMVDDMMIRNLSPATQQSYLYAAAKFSQRAYAGRTPANVAGGGTRRAAPTSPRSPMSSTFSRPSSRGYRRGRN